TDPTHEVLLDPAGHLGGLHPLEESLRLDAQLGGVAHEVALSQTVLVLVKAIVHFPELPAFRRSLGGRGGLCRVRMNLAQREVAEDEPQARSEMVLDRLDDRVRLPAIRALVVAVLDECDRRIGTALSVIAVPHRQREVPHFRPVHVTAPFLSIDSSASRMPSAPGLIPTGET